MRNNQAKPINIVLNPLNANESRFYTPFSILTAMLVINVSLEQDNDNNNTLNDNIEW